MCYDMAWTIARVIIWRSTGQAMLGSGTNIVTLPLRLSTSGYAPMRD